MDVFFDLNLEVTFATIESFSALALERTVSSNNDLAFDMTVLDDMTRSMKRERVDGYV